MPSATEDQYFEARNARPPNLDRWDSVSPKLKSSKYLSAGETEGISPLMLAKAKEVDDFDLDVAPKHHHLHLARLGSRRYSINATRPRMPRFGLDGAASGSASLSGSGTLPMRPAADQSLPSADESKHPNHPHMGALVDELTGWLKDEKAKQRSRKARRKIKRKLARGEELNDIDRMLLKEQIPKRQRSSSSSSESSLGLTELEAILEKRMKSSFDLTSGSSRPVSGSSFGLRRPGPRYMRPPRSSTSLKMTETDMQEEELFVPSCEAVLDNSKTLGYTGGSWASTDITAEDPDVDPWHVFKREIVRLAHTLKLRGWRQVSRSQSNEIHVERLSGALTNAVYVVVPPEDTKPPADQDDHGKLSTGTRRRPVKLLLRIYGPNTGHLIDRETELGVLRRLGKKNIGPRLLGTFTNGRFEEFLHARTLKPQDLRVPDTSRQIAKRMRELHDGIELLEEERDSGPFVWQAWDNCLSRAEKVMNFIESSHGLSRKSSIPTRLQDGLICGTSWALFRSTVERYRKELEREYGGAETLSEQLVFAHNDTQYGNIMRLEPPGESPLLLPANVHKQLVVIDFEYANANVAGLEFANHFTEWCYNYHDPSLSWACNTAHYPTPEEQTRFIRAYVAHQPQHNPAAPSTPHFMPMQSTASMSSVNLERAPSLKGDDGRTSSFSLGPPSLVEQETQRLSEHERADAVAAADEEVHRLLRETQIWRPAKSAQWVVWGILQATIPGMPSFDDTEAEQDPRGDKDQAQGTDPLDEEDRAAAEDLQDKRPEGADEDEHFDYLGYARDRALFFWGDCLQMGLVTEEQLGKDLMKMLKVVPY